jgi:aryl-alcohol dehydrogenase-like predicted oxidoreductase
VRLVQLTRPDLEDALSDSSNWFMEPMAFLHFSAGQRGRGLDQVFAGHMSFAAHRPTTWPARSGAEGHVYVPRLGYLATGLPDEWTEIVMEPSGHSLESASHPQAASNYNFTPSQLIPGTEIELLQHPVAWVERCFAEQEGGPGFGIRSTANQENKLAKAFALLRTVCPTLSRLLEQVLRLVVVFSGERCNSFATTAAHGAVFLNEELGRDEIFLMEDIAHQGGHVLFTAATLDASKLFSVSPSTPVRDWSGDARDPRSVYVALHGAFTEALMACCLDAAAVARVFAGEQEHELEGRLAFILKKLACDRKTLLKPGILSSHGEFIVQAISALWDTVSANWIPLLHTADMSSQDYNFDYGSYAALNPMPTGEGRPSTSALSDRRELKEVSRVGFGCYRTCLATPEHRRALKKALEAGCTLIDTASNYMDGRSEQLVGEVLSECPRAPAFVVTKLGYISPSSEQFLLDHGARTEELHTISAESKYSLAVDSLIAQFKLSCRRLRRQSVDAVLLHNPEHYFDGILSGSAEGRHLALARAFELFESWASEGKVRYYGVSSNSLVADWPDVLPAYLRAANTVSSSHHFRIIEFPFNLLERGAARPAKSGRSLIDEARRVGLVTLGNRPLNALQGAQTFRLATYEAELTELDSEIASGAYENCLTMLSDQIRSLQSGHGAMDFTVMKFLRDNWSGVDNPDLVDEIFRRQFYPFVGFLWNGEPPLHVAEACSDLHRLARLHAKRRLHESALRLRGELEALGLISACARRGLAQLACEFALHSGLNHVLVGMRSGRYVEDLRGLFSAPR